MKVTQIIYKADKINQIPNYDIIKVSDDHFCLEYIENNKVDTTIDIMYDQIIAIAIVEDIEEPKTDVIKAEQLELNLVFKDNKFITYAISNVISQTNEDKVIVFNTYSYSVTNKSHAMVSYCVPKCNVATITRKDIAVTIVREQQQIVEEQNAIEEQSTLEDQTEA